ncbi:unnamed protein product [Rotaria sp. Silwood2]|nr:unnamed protein product [Rotaria sp. Silwood2]CAF4132714.1 unnamed protein product [Rotaria sp. Silwood2]
MAHSHRQPKVNMFDLMQQIISSAKYAREYKKECEALSQCIVRLHDKLTKSSDRLRQELGNEAFDKNSKHLLRTLITVQKLVSECQNPNTTLQGAKKLIAKKTLESDLDGAKLTLINIEADFTSDLQAKRKILSLALQEKQNTNRTRQEAYKKEHVSALLNLIGTETAIFAKKNLGKLYSQHKDIINLYLEQCEKLHTGVPITGLDQTVDSFVKKVHKSADFKSEPVMIDQVRNMSLPVESVYIHLKADHSTTLERDQARKLILNNQEDDDRNVDPYDREMSMGVASATMMESFMERDRFHKKKEDDPFDFQEILRNNRWIVILGDPGSGKTTFVRWLASKYIKDVSKRNEAVDKDESNEQMHGRDSTSSDDDSDDSSKKKNKTSNKNNMDESLVAGSTRMPILMRVGEFAQELAKNSDLSLIDYIGHHTWMGNPMIDFRTEQKKEKEKQQQKQLEKLKQALHDYIKLGYALIILDGLDEIPEADKRSNVVRLVEEFVDSYVPTPKHVTVLDSQFSDRELDIPFQAGGNQLIITSRIAGYHVRPLNGQFSHYTILRMHMDYMKEFVDHWFQTVHQQMSDILNLNISPEDIKQICEVQTDAMKTQLEKFKDSALGQMASNPCLLNFLCLIALQTPEAELPAERICLYDRIAKMMVKLWSSKEGRGLSRNPNIVDRLICDIAIYIHQNFSSGLIGKTDFLTVCQKSLQPFCETKKESEMEQIANQCIDDFKRSTGILIERGQYLYGFLHLTLQEYYTCKSMVTINKRLDRPQVLFNIFQEQILDPRFRVPLTLALGWVSWKWSKKRQTETESEYDKFCEILFKSNHALSGYFPIEILMFLTSMKELKSLPSKKQLFTVFDRLLSIASQNNWHKLFSDLEKRMAAGLLQLPPEMIQEWINRVFSSNESTVKSITSVCSLLRECERLVYTSSNENLKILFKSWANKTVCASLLNHLSHDTIDNEFAIDEILANIAISKSESLFSNDLGKMFIDNPTCLTRLSLPMLAAIIALYGGLTFSNKRMQRELKQSFDYNGNMVTFANFSVIFSPKSMHRKSSLTSFLITYIRDRYVKNNVRIQSDFTNHIQEKAKKISIEDQSLEAVDTFILMFCIIGVDQPWLFKTFVEHKAFSLAIDRFKRIANYLRQLYFIPEIYNRFQSSISSKDSLLSNFNNFDKYMYKQCTVNRDSTRLIELFVNWYRPLETIPSQSSQKSLEILFIFIDLICRGRARLCTTTRTSLTNKWLCKTDQRFLLLPKFFQKAVNLQQLFDHRSTPSSVSNIALPMFLRSLWIFNDIQHGADISEVTIDKAEYSMLREYDKNHFFALAFVSKHLEYLYLRAIQQGYITLKHPYKNQIRSEKPTQTLSFAHILCISLLSVCKPPVSYASQSALIALLPLCRIYQLEHLVLALLYWTNKVSTHDPGAVKWFFEEMQRKTDDEHFLYTDGYDKLSEVERVEISDETVTNGIKHAIEQETHRLQNAIKILKSHDREQEGNAILFAAAVSLGNLCWSSSSDDAKQLFKKVMSAVQKITDPMVRLDAINILAVCPFLLMSEHSVESHYIIEDELKNLSTKTFSELPQNLSPLLFVPFLDRHITLIGAHKNIIDRICGILDGINQMKDENDRHAISIALGAWINLSPDIASRLFRFIKKSTDLSVPMRSQILQFDSPLLSYLTEESTTSKGNNRSFLDGQDHSKSVFILYACLYLINLSSDLQKLPVYLGKSSLMNVDISRLWNQPIGLCQEKRTLTYSHIVAIREKLDALNASESCLNEINLLEKQLHDFDRCELSARSSLAKWLKYKKTSYYYAFASHAALILARTDTWNVDIANILCDLLVTDSNRFSQEVESLFHRKERKSSDLGHDVLLTLIKRFVSFEKKSTHASLVLTWLFEKLTIDDTQHLHAIIEWENKRMEVNDKQNTNIDNSPISTEEQNLLKKSSPIARYFTRFTGDVMKSFTEYIQSFIGSLLNRSGNNRLKTSRRQFIFGWCARIFSSESNNIDSILKIFENLLKRDFSPTLKSSVVFAIGHSSTEQAQSILLKLIKHQLQTDVPIPEIVLAMSVHAYFWSCSCQKLKFSEKETNKIDKTKDKTKTKDDEIKIDPLYTEMLKNESSDIQRTASSVLASICPNVEKLLQIFENDTGYCYRSLMEAIIHPSDINTRKAHTKCVVGLIKANNDSGLLKIFVSELVESMKDVETQIKQYPDWSETFSSINHIEIACDLADEMPAAFSTVIDEVSNRELFQQSLIATSRQHDYRRQNACIKLTSIIGDLTVDVCNMFIDAIVENPSTQATCYDSIKYFRKPRDYPKREQTLQRLDLLLEQLTMEHEDEESPLFQLKSALEDFRSALIALRSPQKYLKYALEKLESILTQLKLDKQLKTNLKQLKSTLQDLEPILNLWGPAMSQLVKHLKSESLNKRWAAANFLERLVQCNVVSALRVQELLRKTIEDDSSKEKLWLRTSDNVQSFYKSMGSLDQMLRKLLMRMFSIDETSIELRAIEEKNRLLEDFQIAEMSAQLASCVNLDEDPDESESESDSNEFSDVDD